jgi:NAD(P)-dependent dehydrogenase (short-subunit alcohol dehydrogenase family)
MDSSLKDQVVLITGAGSGIGAAGALELRRRGAVVVLLDCDEETLAATAQSLGGDVLTAVADVTSLAQCQAAVQTTLDCHGRIDMVWANAGMASFGPLAHTDPAAWKRCIDVNVSGVFNTVRSALPAVIAQRGYVAVTASVSSFAHPPLMSAYAASKAAVEAMCNAWRIELAAHGVGVGAIHAHWVSTALVTEGALHPAFARLRQTMPGLMNRETSAVDAAVMMVDGMVQRRRRIWVPGWVRVLHVLRALLHTPMAERELLRAAPELEALYLQGLATEGALASSFGPRELARAALRKPPQSVQQASASPRSDQTTA